MFVVAAFKVIIHFVVFHNFRPPPKNIMDILVYYMKLELMMTQALFMEINRFHAFAVFL